MNFLKLKCDKRNLALFSISALLFSFLFLLFSFFLPLNKGKTITVKRAEYIKMVENSGKKHYILDSCSFTNNDNSRVTCQKYNKFFLNATYWRPLSILALVLYAIFLLKLIEKEKEGKKSILNPWPFILPPIIFSCYGVFHFYLTNFLEADFKEALFLASVFVILVSFLYGGLNFILKDRLKASLIVSFLTILFYFSSFRVLEKQISSLLIEKYSFDLYNAFYVYVFLFLMFLVIISSKIENKYKIVQFVAFTLPFILLFNLKEPIKFYAFNHKSGGEVIKIKNNAPKNFYLIILDSYPSNYTLKKYMNFDNSAFGNELKNRDFLVFDNMHSNYEFTNLSLASFINLNYIQNLPYKYAADAVGNNLAAKMFKDNGYYYAFLTSYDCFKTNLQNQPDFYSNYANTYYLTQELFKDTFRFINESYENRNIAISILNVFKKTEELSKLNRPKFVISHVLLPHPPFVFGKNGNIKDAPDKEEDEISQSKEQILYANKLTIDLIDSIFENSSKGQEPVIIIMGDHGLIMPSNFYKWNHNSGFTQTAEEIKLRSGAFMAVYMPDKKYEIFSDNRTLVNFYRTLMGHYFEKSFPKLEDRFYHGCLERAEYHNINSEIKDATSIIKEDLSKPLFINY